MVDVSQKAETRRTARAQAFVRIAPRVLRKLPENPKGNSLEISRSITVEIEDEEKPALVAEWVTRVVYA